MSADKKAAKKAARRKALTKARNVAKASRPRWGICGDWQPGFNNARWMRQQGIRA